MLEQRIGALYVVGRVPDRDEINQRLKQLDPRLFLEKQMTFADEEVWCVVEDTGERFGPDRFVTVHEHRGPDGRPLEHLSDRIVDEMQQRAREKNGRRVSAAKIATARNRERIEQAKRIAQEQASDISRDFDRHRIMGNFAVVPRSQQLARTRARVRSTQAEQLRATREAMRIAVAVARRGNRASLTA